MRLLARARSSLRFGLLGLAALSASSLAVSVATSTPAAAGVTVTGTGSSYAAVALNNWVGQVANLYGLSINYQTSSSVLGLQNFPNNVDFAASEIGYSTNTAPPPPPGSYQYLPDVAGAQCLMYNLQSTTSQPVRNLQLNSAVMTGIFSGQINKWNDPAILAINPALNGLLPNTTINFVFRTDASGDNYIFSQYLASLQTNAWAAFRTALVPSIGGAASQPTDVWPSPQGGSNQVGAYDFTGGLGVSGSDGASNTVAGTPNSITYVETAYAILHGIPCAAVQNASGAYVQPSSVGDAIALTHDALYPDLEQNLAGVFTAPEAGAYPISAYSYLITSINGSPAKNAVLGKFIAFLACQGQISAGQLGYSPIPPNLVADDFAAIQRLPGAAPPPALNGTACPNPYLTGAAQYVGGPIQLSSGGGGGVQANTAASSAAVAAAGVTQVSPSAVAAAAAHHHGGLEAAPGQQFGLALAAEANSLLRASTAHGAALALSAGFLAIVLVPPAIGFVLYRRRKSRGDA